MKTRRTLLMLLLAALTAAASAQSTGSDDTTTRPYFIDGVDFQEFGSYIRLEDLIHAVDWRGRDFEDYPNYWDFYGVTDLYVDLESVECDLGDGDWQKLPVTIQLEMDKTNLTGTYLTADRQGTVDSRFGFLTYRNNGTVLQKGFQIRFYGSMDYKWGTLRTTDKIVIDVRSTIINNDDNGTTGTDGNDTSAGSNEATGTTAIIAVPAEQPAADIYDLQGRRVANGQWSMVNGQLPRGIYIVNGRKVVVK